MTPISHKSISSAAAFLVASVIGAACLNPHTAFAQGAPDYAAIIAAPDRSDADRKTDERRDPLKLLVFTDARPGMKVLDMGAGGGYSSELMARAVTPGGTVYAQNPPDLPERGKARFDARLQTPAGKNIVGLTRAFDDPVPADVHDLDLITFLFFYHDTTYMNVDRAAMNRKLFAALKPGGTLIIADHSARLGDGTTVGKTLHRIEEAALRREVENAGFKVVGEGNFWRHPEDQRDFSIQPVSGKPVDEFVLKFQKPN
ncbi:MAG: class I SAM-dependent methyltransferase [Xanthobacteraceae bacterium]|nr:class I SAM-dependent methyltransferase [Xanthobacteraceae bacterium]